MKFLLPILLLLSGCAGSVITNAVVQPNVSVSVPTADPMLLNAVKWQVLSVAQLKTLVATLEANKQQNAVVFVLDSQNYTNLQLNFVEIERYIKEENAIISMLKQVIAQRSGQTSSSTTRQPSNGN